MGKPMRSEGCYVSAAWGVEELILHPFAPKEFLLVSGVLGAIWLVSWVWTGKWEFSHENEIWDRWFCACDYGLVVPSYEPPFLRGFSHCHVSFPEGTSINFSSLSHFYFYYKKAHYNHIEIYSPIILSPCQHLWGIKLLVINFPLLNQCFSSMRDKTSMGDKTIGWMMQNPHWTVGPTR